MAISTKHTFISVKADGPDSTVVQPSDWNADHTMTLAAGKVVGRVSGSSGAAQELPLVFDSTLQSMIPPVGTTAQRPATPAAGMMRYNSNTAQLEMYRNSAWGAVGGNAFVGAAAPTNPQEGDFWYNSTSGQIQIYVAGAWVLSTTNLFANTFSGNGVQTVFVLTVDPGTKQNTMVYISGVYQEKSKYSVSGTSLTFITAPANGSVVEVTLMSTTTIGVPNNGSVTTAKVADGAITAAKLAVAYQPALGFTPVEQGGNAGMGANKINLGWRTDGRGFQANVDSAYVGMAVVNSQTPAGVGVGRNNGTIIAPGAPPLFACRAWVSFEGGVGNRYASGNVSSVVRNALGDFTIFFTDAMPDVNYATIGTCSQSGEGQAVEAIHIQTITATAVRVYLKWANSATGGFFNPSYASIAIFR